MLTTNSFRPAAPFSYSKCKLKEMGSPDPPSHYIRDTLPMN